MTPTRLVISLVGAALTVREIQRNLWPPVCKGSTTSAADQPATTYAASEVPTFRRRAPTLSQPRVHDRSDRMNPLRGHGDHLGVKRFPALQYRPGDVRQLVGQGISRVSLYPLHLNTCASCHPIDSPVD